MVENMSDAQFRAASESRDLTAEQRQQLQTARGAAIGTRVAGRGAASGTRSAAQAGLRTASSAELRTLGIDYLLKEDTAGVSNAAHLSQSQFDDIVRSDNYVEQDKTALRTARNDGLQAMFAANAASVFEGRNPAEVAQLPDSILGDAGATPYLNSAVLTDIARNGRATGARHNIRTYVQAAVATPGPHTPQEQARLDAMRDFFNTNAGRAF